MYFSYRPSNISAVQLGIIAINPKVSLNLSISVFYYFTKKIQASSNNLQVYC